MTPAEIHNRDAGDIVRRIVKPTLNAGGHMTQVLVLLESVVTGVLTVAVKLGGDNYVLDTFIDGVRARMAEIRLRDLPVVSTDAAPDETGKDRDEHR